MWGPVLVHTPNTLCQVTSTFVRRRFWVSLVTVPTEWLYGKALTSSHSHSSSPLGKQPPALVCSAHWIHPCILPQRNGKTIVTGQPFLIFCVCGFHYSWCLFTCLLWSYFYWIFNSVTHASLPQHYAFFLWGKVRQYPLLAQRWTESLKAFTTRKGRQNKEDHHIYKSTQHQLGWISGKATLTSWNSLFVVDRQWVHENQKKLTFIIIQFKIMISITLRIILYSWLDATLL